MARALKVFRTAIGFHDAYVAAPSRKAALAAWGSSANLFARGMAEEINDPALMAAPLASPGMVIKLARGTAAEHFAALPATKAKAPAKKTAKVEQAEAPRPPTPPPSRRALEEAEARIDAATREQRAAVADIDRREAALQAERRKLDTEQAAAMATLTEQLDREKRAYDEAVDRWRDSD